MTKGRDLFNASRKPKVCIVGFADSKRQLARFLDGSWSLWSVNDLYHYLPGMDVVFEVHHLDNMGNRRNAEHLQSLATGQFGLGPAGIGFCQQYGIQADMSKRELPVVMQEEHPDIPTSMALPRAEIIDAFKTEYFTSSIAWMLAFAILELTEVKDGIRVPIPGAEIATCGIHMAAETEYRDQRPCCEYWIGVARGLGIPVYVPDEAELLKSASLYGYVSSSPVAVKIQSRLQTLSEQTIVLQQQEAQALQMLEQARAGLAGCRGAKQELRLIYQNFCSASDVMPGDPRGLSEQQQKDRGVFQLADGSMVPQVALTDGQPQEVPVGSHRH